MGLTGDALQRIINHSSSERAIIPRADTRHETRNSEAQKRSQIRHPTCPFTRGVLDLSNLNGHTVLTFSRGEIERYTPRRKLARGTPVNSNCKASLHHTTHATQALCTVRPQICKTKNIQSSNGNHACKLQTKSVDIRCRQERSVHPWTKKVHPNTSSFAITLGHRTSQCSSQFS